MNEVAAIEAVTREQVMAAMEGVSPAEMDSLWGMRPGTFAKAAEFYSKNGILVCRTGKPIKPQVDWGEGR